MWRASGYGKYTIIFIRGRNSEGSGTGWDCSGDGESNWIDSGRHYRPSDSSINLQLIPFGQQDDQPDPHPNGQGDQQDSARPRKPCHCGRGKTATATGNTPAE